MQSKTHTKQQTIQHNGHEIHTQGQSIKTNGWDTTTVETNYCGPLNITVDYQLLWDAIIPCDITRLLQANIF